MRKGSGPGGGPSNVYLLHDLFTGGEETHAHTYTLANTDGRHALALQDEAARRYIYLVVRGVGGGGGGRGQGR